MRKQHKTTLGNRTLAMLLALVMVIGLLPMTAFAVNKVATPTYGEELNPDNMFTGSTNTRLNCSTSGATLWYTIDGSDPRTSETRSEFYYTETNATIKIKDTTTIKAYAVKEGMEDSDLLEFTLTDAVRVKEPDFRPSESNFSESLSVTIACDTKDATIYYTTDGSEPSRDNGTTYRGPFYIRDTTTIKAVAYKGGMNTSFVVTKTYTESDTVKLKPNTAYLADAHIVKSGHTGSYGWHEFSGYYGDSALDYKMKITTDSKGNPTITIPCIYKYYADNYITDLTIYKSQSSTDVADGLVFETIADSGTTADAIKGVATLPLPYVNVAGVYYGNATTAKAHDGFKNSKNGKVELHILWDSLKEIQDEVEAPTFSAKNNTVFDKTTNEVALNCETPGATIYYTTDKFFAPDPSDPTTALKKYTPGTPIVVTGKIDIAAIAKKDGMDDSAVTRVAYDVKAKPELDPNATYEVGIEFKDMSNQWLDYDNTYVTPAEIRVDGAGNGKMTIDFIYNGGWSMTYVKDFTLFTEKNGNTPISDLVFTDMSANLVDKQPTGKAVFTLPYIDGEGVYHGKTSFCEDANYDDVIDDPVENAAIELVIDWTTLKKTGNNPDQGGDGGAQEQVATPVITPNGGEVEKDATVEITSSTKGATIYYTMDGTTPTSDSAAYTAPIAITEDVTIKAIGVKKNHLDSEVATAVFTVKATEGGTPDGDGDDTGKPAKYTITATFADTLSGVGEGLYGPEATIMKDAAGKMNINIQLLPGFDMASFSTIYYNAMTVYTDSAKGTQVAGQDFKAATGYSDLGYLSFDLTDKTTETYYIEATMQDGVTVRTGLVTLDWSTLKEVLAPVETPVIAPTGGELEPTDTITITCATEGATIYYTLGDGWTNPFDWDGNPDPTAILYEGPFTIDDATTVTAQASKAGMANSASGSAKFTVNGASKKLGDMDEVIYHKDSPFYNLVTFYTEDAMYQDIMKPSTGMPTVSEYYILVEQGKLSERHLWNGGIGGFYATKDGEVNKINVLLSKDKWNPNEEITFTIVAKGYDSKKIVLNLKNQVIESQKNTTTDAGIAFENRADVEEGKTYTATFTAIKTGTTEESMLAGFFEPTAKIVVGTNGTTNITFRNMVMPEQLQDLGLKGSGNWSGAVTDGSRVESAEDALFTIPVSTKDFKNGFFLGGVNVLAMGGAISNNGAYEKYTSVEITFADEVVTGFAGFESALNGLTEEKKLNRLLVASNFDADDDGYVSPGEIAGFSGKKVALSSSDVYGYSPFDDLKIKDISWLQQLPKEKITSIDLTSHGITAIDGEFKGFTNLESLTLRSNAIIGITDGAFSDLGKLTNLGLSSNAITKVTSGTFDGLTNLGNNAISEFSLAQNNIQTIESGAFSDLEKVKNLFLYDNKIVNIPAGTLTGMNSLERLEIYENKLREIPADIKGMKNLKHLDLHDNEIKEISNRLIPVSYLNLSNNFITTLPESFATTMAKAKSILLSGNDLKTLPADFVRMTLKNVGFQNVYVNNPIDVNLLKNLTADELEQVKEILKISGVSSSVVKMAITAMDGVVTYTQALSAFDLYFWNYAISKDSHKPAIQAALGKNTIDSVGDYKTFRNHNLPNFSAGTISSSIFGDATNSVTDYTITTSLQKQVAGKWITVATTDQNGGEDAKSGKFTDLTMRADNQYRLVKTIGNYAVIAYGNATMTEDDQEEDTSLVDGVYSVPVSVKKYGESGTSMANGAVVGTAKAALNGDTIVYTLTFKGMTLNGLYGHLTDFWYYAAADTKLNDPMAPDKMTYYVDYDMGGKTGGNTAKFPSTVTFTHEGTVDDDVIIYVEVDAMNQNGTGKQNAVLIFDWTRAKNDGGASSGGTSGGLGEVDPEEELEETPKINVVTAYSDIEAYHWYKDAVSYVVNAGLFQGTSKTTFAPNEVMTRAMVMTVLARMAGEDTSRGATWYQVGMNWAVRNGVSDGTDLNDPVTREQLATMLCRYAKGTGTAATLSAYTDATAVSSWARKAMGWAISKGVVNGKTKTTLAPQANATRAEVATMMMRFAELMKK